MTTEDRTLDPDLVGEPVWDIARLFPNQGQWSVEEYLALDTNHLVEFSHGHIEVLPMPTHQHQRIVFLLARLLYDFVAPQRLGTVLPAALPVRLWPGKYREPDVVFMRAEHEHRCQNQYWEGADLVMEVVSPGTENRTRDLEIKRHEYPQAGIPEYWIVDPEQEQVTVLSLSGGEYGEHGVFRRGDTATSRLLPGFAVAVDDVFTVA